MKYFICGFSGAGKSYLVKQLENSFQLGGFQFFDTDFLIDQDHANEYESLAHLINEKGMEHFRELEKSKLQELNSMENIIVSLGGGTIDQWVSDFFAQNSWNGFWLSTDFSKCYERIKNDVNRPLSKLPMQELEQIHAKRLKFYQNYEEISDYQQVIQLIKG